MVALVITGLFAMRLGRRVVDFRRAEAPPIAGWMTMHYVARAYGVPPPVLYKALDVAGDREDRRPLEVIAREKGQPVDVIIADLKAAIEQFYVAPPQPPDRPDQPRPPENRP